VDRSGSHRDPSSWSGGRPDHFRPGWLPRRSTTTDRTRSFRARLLHLDRHGWTRARQTTYWVPRRGGGACSSARVVSTQYIIHIHTVGVLSRDPRPLYGTPSVLLVCWTVAGSYRMRTRCRQRERPRRRHFSRRHRVHLRRCSNSGFNMDMPVRVAPWRF
jgi:hypothetical protein